MTTVLNLRIALTPFHYSTVTHLQQQRALLILQGFQFVIQGLQHMGNK